MEKKEIISEFIEYSSADELPEEERELILLAGNAAKDAYAPYSNFNVGAAVLMSNGKIITANNQENAAYPSGLCAERIAVFSAVAQNPGIKIKSIAIIATSQNVNIDKPVSPCGACRQVIAEYEILYKSEIKILMSGNTGKVFGTNSIKNLLPLLFNSSSLKNE